MSQAEPQARFASRSRSTEPAGLAALDRLRDELASRSRAALARPGARAAAVLVPIVVRPAGLALLCTVRTKTVLEHKGEVSFPGGAVDAGDEDTVRAALRETNEELGIAAGAVRVLGMLDDVFTVVSNYIISPVVGVLDREPSVVPHAAEVDRPLYVSLADLVRRGARRYEVRGDGGAAKLVYAYDVGPDTIWGATARITHALLKLWRPTAEEVTT